MKRKILALALLAVMLVSVVALTACGANKMEKATITSVWPNNEFTKAVPKMECGKLFSYTEFVKGDRMLFVVTDATREEYDAYREELVKFGYKETKVENDEDANSTTAEYRRDGWEVSIFFGANITLKVYKK